MGKVLQVIAMFFSLPVTIYINFRCLPLSQAVKLPVFVHWRTKILQCSGKIELSEIRPGIVKLGFGGTKNIHTTGANIFALEKGSVMRFVGKVNFGKGFSIHNKGTIEIHDNFFANKNFNLFCINEILIEENSICGWDVEIRDMEGHDVIHRGKSVQKNPIHIGKHVWIAAEAVIFAGTEIGDGSIVAMRSLVNKKFTEKNVLLAGSPAMIKAEDMDWKRR